MHRIWVVLLLLCTLAPAQDRTGTITGIVRDDTGAVLQGATVGAVHVDTGRESTAVTSRTGSYSLLGLTPGRYQVTASLDGFKASRHDDVLLEVDRAAVVNHRLQVGDARESIVVQGEAHLIDATPSALTSVVDGRTIQQLPLNGRDYIQLVTLQAGAVVARATDRDADTGYGLQFSVSGSRPFQNSVRVDGLTLTTYNGTTPASTNGLNLGVDSTAEFSVNSSAFSAQYGQSAGAVINVVTKSGSNDWHGTAFYFHRNDNLDARNFFDGPEVPEFRRHQYGVSLGGPIVRNKTFFFTNYEALREERGTTTVNTTLSEAAHRGVLTTGTVAIDPNIAGILGLFPLPNGDILGDTGIFSFANPVVSDQNFTTTRVDHRFSDFDQAFLRYTWDGGDRSSFTDFAIGRRNNSTRNQSAVLEETHIFSPRLLNTARIGFLRTITRDGATQSLNPATDRPEVAAIPGSTIMPVLLVGGVSDFPGGTNAGSNDHQAMNSYQLSDDLVFTAGAHTLKFGGRVERTHFNSDSQNRPHGDFRFSNVSTFLRNVPNRFRGLLPGADTIRGYRQWIGAFYIQDTWRLHPRFTWDMGLRWDANSVPTEVNGKVANLVNLTDSQMHTGDPMFRNPSLKNFVPRVGMAWDIFGNGSLLVRSGYGIFPDLILSPYISFLGSRNPPFFQRGETRTLSQGAFPKGGYLQFVNNPTIELATERIPPDVQQPYVQQWNFTVEQRLDPTTMLRVAYVGSHGVHLSGLVADANLRQPVIQPDGRLFFPANAPFINQTFGQIRNRTFDAHSFYNGLQTTFQRRLARGLQTQINYTYSKSIDDSSNFFSSSESSNRGLAAINDMRIDRGLSGHDVRHALSINGIWDLPVRAGRGWRYIAGGWQAGGVYTYSSGVPTSVWLAYDAARTGSHQSLSSIGQRPDLAPGATNPVTHDPNRWVDIGAFRRPEPGYLGNLGRNTIEGPDYATLDFSAVKRFPVTKLGDQASLDLRFEFFNLLNRTNFNLPSVDRMESFGETTVREDFARITSASESREIQLGIKLRF